jgi:hypothetical protein
VRLAALLIVLATASPLSAQTAPKPQAPTATAPKPTLKIERDPATLPPRVSAMRDAILEAARSGDIEKMRAPIERNEMPPVFARGQKGDLVALLKNRAGDPQGRETLAILIDLLEAGWVRTNVGTPQEMYVWPWFAEVPPDQLTPPQVVEALRVMSPRDWAISLARGRYGFWKIGIAPDGTWHYFFAE